MMEQAQTRRQQHNCQPRIADNVGQIRQHRLTNLLPLLLLACLILIFPAHANAQVKPTDYARTEAMVPMRDGVRLYTQIDAPAHAAEPLPILFLRTPYGLGELKPDQVAAALPEL